LPPGIEEAAVSGTPLVVAETEGFAVLFKPPGIHCAPLRPDDRDTLLHRYARIFPPVMELRGRKEREGGLVHRLDFDTGGLVLVAKNRKSLDSLTEQQAAGNFAKEYGAICRKAADLPCGFPPEPAQFRGRDCATFVGLAMESFFRPFGPGRKQVRPTVDSARRETARDRGDFYRTEILGVTKSADTSSGHCRFAVRLKRGFRHQVRCHLAWIGHPILNDPLYGIRGALPHSRLALRAEALFFADPESGRPLEYRIPPLELPPDSGYN